MKRRAMCLVLILALSVMTISTAVLAGHWTTDERPITTLEEFREDVGSWIDPWLENSESSLADDHAPLVAHALYEELLSIRPEPCYWDTYAAYWAVAADLRALGQAPSREQQAAETVRIFEDVARAEALAALNDVGCATWGSEASDVAEVEEVATMPRPDRTPIPSLSPSRVIEIDATASLQYKDESGDSLEEIAVSPGEVVVFRVHNSAGFDHNFYIGSGSELEEPGGTTDVGIPTWSTGVRELAWTVPDDVSALMFGCTVPGHYPITHGTFALTPLDDDTLRD